VAFVLEGYGQTSPMQFYPHEIVPIVFWIHLIQSLCWR